MSSKPVTPGRSVYDLPPADAAGPLAGIRVVDATGARAGPTCVRQLADMGADVIQVCGPGRADLGGSDRLNLHRNKRSIVVDLKEQAGRDVLMRLVDRADVFVENYRPPVKRKLGIAPEQLLARNPRLIYASISGFGQDGPDADRPGVDQVAQGYGLMSITGQPGTGPSRVGIAITDTGSGMFLTQGVLAALVARQRTGRGQWVHTSLLETMINMLDFQAARWLIDREVPGQAGNHHPTVSPMGTFKTSDGYMNIAPITAAFVRFCELIGAPELPRDPRFVDGHVRARHRQELNDAIEKITVTRTAAEWIDILANEIPCGRVMSMDEVFADPQVQHLRVTRTVTTPEDREVEVLRLPITFSDTPAGIRRGPPAAGAHTIEVLEELGYSQAEMEALVAAGAVATIGGGKEWGHR